MTARQPSTEPLISLAETAERLGMPLQTFYDHRKHGRGPKGFRIGRRVMFLWSEVVQWRDAQREPEPVTAFSRDRRSA